MRKLALAVTGAISIMVASQAAHAQAVQYVFYPYPPFGIVNGDAKTGYMADMVLGMLDRGGIKYRIEEVPVVRARNEMEGTPNTIGTSTKTKELVEGYSFSFFNCFETVTHNLIAKKAKGFKDLASVPKTTVIGAFQGYTLLNHLASLGYGDVHVVRENPLLVEMLSLDRIEAWASFGAAAMYILEEKGINLGEYDQIPILEFPFCVTASKGTDPQIVQKMKDAYASMVADGTREKIRAKYAAYLGVDKPPVND